MPVVQTDSGPLRIMIPGVIDLSDPVANAHWKGAAFRAGDMVEIYGLQGAAQHNGKRGLVQARDPAQDIYQVAVQGESAIAVMSANLKCVVANPLA